jgi:hypothetical protein
MERAFLAIGSPLRRPALKQRGAVYPSAALLHLRILGLHLLVLQTRRQRGWRVGHLLHFAFRRDERPLGPCPLARSHRSNRSHGAPLVRKGDPTGMVFQASAENKATFERPLSAPARGRPYSYHVKSACGAHLPNPPQIGWVHAQREWPSRHTRKGHFAMFYPQPAENPWSSV